MEMELLTQRLLDSAAMEIVVLDTEERITEINRNSLQQTGFERAAVVGHPAGRLWDEISLQKLREDLSRNRIFQGELTEITLGGEPRSIHYTFSPIRGEFGEKLGYIGIGRPMMDTDRFEMELLQRLEQIRQTQGVAMVGLAKLAEYRDPETGQHLERMRNYCRLFAEELSTLPEYSAYITDEYIEGIYNSSPLHDIGKVGIPDAILLKPGRLTPQEFEVMKQHSRIGGDALRAADQQLEGESFLTMGKEIAYHHHEKWDGTGYPDGLRGNAIPLSARIVAISDVYDALTSKRVYKDAISHDRARAIIIESSGSHFAEDLVRVFLKREADILKIRERFKD
jgi:PAS domain S-box-containing protein